MTGKKTEEENEIIAKYDYEQFLDILKVIACEPEEW